MDRIRWPTLLAEEDVKAKARELVKRLRDEADKSTANGRGLTAAGIRWAADRVAEAFNIKE